MSPDVIKSFLVGLGFGVDDKSLSEFNKAITSATLKVSALYGATKLMAAGIVAGISKISEGFEQMGYEYRIIAPAINKALLLRRELLKAYSAAGINITKVIQSSVKLNFSLAKTKFAFEALYRSVASRFFDTLTKQSDSFRNKIYANLPKIQKYLEKGITALFHFIDAVQRLVGTIWDLFVRLDTATDGWSTKILAAVAAWKLLNLSFLATPLGLIIAGLIGILALFDDFKAWQEGGQSVFDWSSFVPTIDAVSKALGAAWAVLNQISDVLSDILVAFYQLFTGDFSGAWDTLKHAVAGVVVYFEKLWEYVKSIGGVLSAVGSWGGQFFGAPNAAANAGAAAPGAAGQGAAGHVGGSTQNSTSNQHVQQQTNINVVGSADASSVGRAVAGEQGRVNFDLARNMKGATR